jgi:hypothetical protein
MRLSNSFIISLAGLVSLLVLGLAKGIDVSMAISGVVLAYSGSRASQKIGLGVAVSKDANASMDNHLKDLKD